MKAEVCVTGASGFIGSFLVESLVADGIPVRAFVKTGSGKVLTRLGKVEVCEGDIKDRASLDRAMAGVQTVYHLAAISRYDVNVPESEYHAVNVAGTRNVLDAALQAGVSTVVFTATIEAVGMSGDGRPLTEETPQHPRNIYGQTKMEAERLVLDYGRSGRIRTVVVRPPMIYGPCNEILFKRLFGIVRRGFYPLIGDGRALTEFCYVKNQVHGLRLAAERGRSGEVYFISDERSYEIEEIVDAIARAMERRVVKLRIPVPAALAMGFCFEMLAKVLRFYPFVIPETGRPPFSRKTVEWTSQSRLFCDTSKARRELGYVPPYTLDEGVSETVAWYRANGFMK